MATAAQQARSVLWNAIWFRGFPRGSVCTNENCGNRDPESAIRLIQDDVSRPLEVRAICASCHNRAIAQTRRERIAR